MQTQTSYDSKIIKSKKKKLNESSNSKIINATERKRRQEIRLSYLRGILKSLKIDKTKKIFSKKLKLNFQITYIILSATISITSVIIYAIQFHLKKQSDLSKKMFYINFFFAHFFFIEFIINLFLSKDKIAFFLQFQPWVDILTLVVPYISLFLLNCRLSFAFFRILRIMSIFKLFSLLKHVSTLSKDLQGKEEKFIIRGQNSKVKKEILKLFIFLISMIIILAGLVQQISTFVPNSFSMDYLNFIDALYFMIITLSTVGYGDIYPNMIYTRMMILCIISYFVYKMSEQITNIVKLYKSAQNLQITYDFTDHIIIFGENPNDNLTQIHFINFFEELYYDYFNNIKSFIKSPHCIIITIFDENKSWSKIKNFCLYGIKIFILPVKRFDAEAFLAANFAHCKAIYCFNNNIDSEYLITDKIISFYVRNLGNIIEDETVFKKNKKSNRIEYKSEVDTYKCKKLFVQFLYKEIDFSDLINKNIFPQLILPRTKLKYSLSSKNIFVKGWTTLITNLFHKHTVLIHTKHKSNNYYLDIYLSCMNQSLKTIKFPEFLHGKLFKDCVKLIYLASTEYINNIKNKDKVYEFNYENLENINSSGILLIGVMTTERMSNYLKNEENKTEVDKEKNKTFNLEIEEETKNHFKKKNEKKENKNEEDAFCQQISLLIKNIKYNEPDYIIDQDDFGIFIFSDFLNIEDFFIFLTQQNEFDNLFTTKFFQKIIEKGKKIKSRTNSIILNDATNTNQDFNLENKLFNFFLNESNRNNLLIEQKYNNRLISENNNLSKTDIVSNNVSKRYIKCALLDFHEFFNHILILGWNTYMEGMIIKIRMHSLLNTIVILADDIPNDESLLNKFPNLYLVHGNYLDLKVLENINTNKAAYVIIITSKSDVNPNREDTNSVLVARMIDQYFQTPYILEIREDSNSNLLGSVPILNHSEVQREAGGGQKEKNILKSLYINPNFIQGKILFNCIFDKMNARALHKNFDVACIKELIELDFKKKNNIKFFSQKEKINFFAENNNNSNNNKDNYRNNVQLDFETKIYTDTTIQIFSYPLDKYFLNKKYKDLLKELLEINMIPLGVYIKNPKKWDNELKNINQLEMESNEECIKINNIKKPLSIINSIKDHFPLNRIKSTKDPLIKINISKDQIIDKSNFEGKSQLSKEKLKYYSNLLTQNLDNNVLDFCQLENINTPILVTNPHHDMILNPEMEIIILGNYHKIKSLGSPSNIVNEDNVNNISNELKKKRKSFTDKLKRLKSIRKKVDTVKNIFHKLDKKLKRIKLE